MRSPAVSEAALFDWAAVLGQLDTIRALTCRQPWEWAIRDGGKPVENRPKPLLRDGGLLWLHAGRRDGRDPAGQASPLVRDAWAAQARARPDAHNSIWLLRKTSAWMPFGAITALMEIRGCHHARDCAVTTPARPDLMVMCSPWAAGYQHHIEIAAVHPLPEPVQCRGMLGAWPVPAVVLPELRAAIAAAIEPAHRPAPLGDAHVSADR